MSSKTIRRVVALSSAAIFALLFVGAFIFTSQASAQISGPDDVLVADAQIRVAHLAPFDSLPVATAVDVKLNGTEVLTAFQYLSSTTYIEVPEGQYLVEVFPTGSMTPAITATVDLVKNKDYTAIAHGGANGHPLELTFLLDDNKPVPPDKSAWVRFGHLAPFDPVLANTAADIRTDDGSLVLGPVLYGDIASTYLELPEGEYDLEVTTAGGADVLIDLAPFTLNAGDILYALAVGDGANQATGVFAYPTDLEGFLLPTEQDANLRVAHLAPFDSLLANTAVDVKLDGTQVLTAFQYLSSTTYIDIPIGEYLVEVFPTGSSTVAISATVNLAENEDYTAIAYGGANGYDLTLAALLDDNDAPAAGNGKVRFGHLAPFDPVLANTAADIRTDDGSLVLGPVLYGDIASTYLELPEGEYDLEVTTAGGADVLIDLAPFTLNEGDILYALAVGDGTNQDTNVFAYPTDLQGFLLPKEAEFANLRVAHLAPFDSLLANTAVDVKLDGTQVLTAFQYLSSTTYIEVPEGTYLVEVFPTGTSTAVLSGTVALQENSDYTAIAHGGANGYDLTLAALLDDNDAPAAGNGKVRFGHLAPFDPVLANTAADIRTDDGSLILGPVLYGDIASTYLELPEGEYDLEVTTAGGADVLIDLAPFTLNAGDILYALAVGDGANQATGVFAYPTDLEGFLLPTEQDANLRVAHLAPFDSLLANTAVDVKLDGTQVLTAFQYLSSTTYIDIPIGEYLVEVFPTGSSTAAISATVNLAENEDYTAIAYGGANGYDLTLAALLDDNVAPAAGNGKVRFGHLAPFDPVLANTAADIRTDDGSLILGPVLYGDIASTYLELPEGEYDLEVTTAGGADVLIDLAPFTLNEGDILYALAVGDGTNQDTNVFAYPTDLQGFLLPKEAEFANLRVAHLAPFDSLLANTAVDVKLDGTQVLTAFQYLSSTTYIEVPEGTYLVEVFPTGTSTAVLSGTVALQENSDYTAIAHGGANGYDLTLAALLDDNDAPAAGNGKVRFGHLAPFDPVLANTAADIRTDDGSLILGPVLYGDIASTYLELPEGEYDLEVTTAGGADVLIDLAPFTLNAGDILYALAVGDGANQATGVFAYPTDLEGFLLPTEQDANLRVAHLAPFDSLLANTAVDVKLDGTQVLTAFQYLSSTTYIDIPIGEYLVEVFPTGSSTAAISATVNLAENEDYTAIAYGGANGYDLTLAALLDDNVAPAAGNGKVRFGHLAPFDPVLANTAADIRTDDGSLILGPVLYGDIASTYLELPEGEYDLEVTTAGGADVLIDLAPFTLNEGDILYALAVGDGTNQDTNVFAYPTDLQGFLLPKEPLYQIYLPFVSKDV